MQKIIILLLSAFAGPLLAPAQPYFQQQVDYNIDVTLNDTDRSLDGFMATTCTYTNHSHTIPSLFIWMHWLAQRLQE